MPREDTFFSNRLFCCLSFIIAMVNRIPRLRNSCGRRSHAPQTNIYSNLYYVSKSVKLKGEETKTRPHETFTNANFKVFFRNK